MSTATSKPYDYQYKVLIVGDSAVGKTSLLTRFVDEAFYGNYLATIGIDYKIKNIEMDDKRVRLQIWDTAGQERFRTITGAYFRKAMGIVLVYDITSQRSFDSLGKWLESIQRNAPEDTKVILVGNKCEMNVERQVQFDKAKEMGDKYGIDVLEISAKENINVVKAFMDLTRLIKDNNQKTVNGTQDDAKNEQQTNQTTCTPSKSTTSNNDELSNESIKLTKNLNRKDTTPKCGSMCT